MQAERLKEEEEKKQKEFDQWKDQFSVQEEGLAVEDVDSETLLQQFLAAIEQRKVVLLEDLAQEFKLSTKEIVRRVEELQSLGRLSGIMDDRGKFISITEEEFIRVADFIQKKGRISIRALAQESNRLIRLTPHET